MSLVDPTDTLAYHQSRVLTDHRRMSDVTCQSVAVALKAAINASNTGGNATPETEALWFYAMNHGMALISATRDKLEPLSPEELKFVNDYHKVLGPKAARAFQYMLVICIREARHNQSLVASVPLITKHFGQGVGDFHALMKASGEGAIHTKFMNSPPAATIGNLCKSLCWVYYNSKWHGGYGGPKWGQVADCLSRFVTGEFTAEMMLDTVWTLSHNNGPIFNKGMLYSHYNMHDLIQILDVQRAGQIPELVLNPPNNLKKYIESSLVEYVNQIIEIAPHKIGAYVDWWQVEALGAKQSYPAEKTAQSAIHGIPSGVAELEKKKILANSIAMAKAKAEAEAAEKEAAEKQVEFLKTHWEMMPGQYVQKIDRKAA